MLSEIQAFRQAVLALDGSETAFNQLALEIFRWQAQQNPLYREYLHRLNILPQQVKQVQDIPCLPIGFFKSHQLKSGSWQPMHWFESSGTTGSTTSRHYVPDTSFYHQHARHIFERHYGSLDGWIILALLPSYLEREHASLVSMAGHFIQESRHPLSGFYLDNHRALREAIGEAAATGRKLLLLGVSFALLDLAEEGELPIPEEQIVVMETGGMKGRRKEMIREALHAQLCAGLGVASIHSEYGMTELFSQAYAQGQGIFKEPASMRVLIRDINDPFSPALHGRSGGVNLIDLANVHSCCFLESQDLGRKMDENSFEILGRFDQADIRGCNLLVI